MYTLLALLLAQAPAPAELRDSLAPAPGGLTVHQVADRAVAASPGARQADAELRSAAARLNQTMVQFFPSLTATATYARVNPLTLDFVGGFPLVFTQAEGPLSVGACPTGGGQCVVDSSGAPAQAVTSPPFELPVDNLTLQVQLGVPITDYIFRLSAARRGSQADRDAARLRRDRAEQQAMFDAIAAYYDWQRARARVVASERTLESLRARHADAVVAADNGLLTKSDVLQLDATVAGAEVATSQVHHLERTAARVLAAHLEDNTDDLSSGEDIYGDTLDGSVAPEEELVAVAVENRADLAALRRTRDSLGDAVSALKADYIPRLDAFGEVTHANPNQRFFPTTNEWNTSWSVGVRATWTLNQAALARGRIRQLRADADALSESERALLRGVEIEVATARQDVLRAQQAAALQRRAVASANAAYDAAVLRFQAGESTATDMIEAESRRLDAQVGEFDARVDLRLSKLRLRHAVGQLDPAVQR